MYASAFEILSCHSFTSLVFSFWDIFCNSEFIVPNRLAIFVRLPALMNSPVIKFLPLPSILFSILAI